MMININELPEWAKLEIKRDDLLAFAEALIGKSSKTDKIDEPEKADISEEDKILSFTEMRRYLKLAQSTAYQKVSNGEIPHFKKGRRLYFKKKELQAYVESGRRSTKKDLDTIAQDYLNKSKIQ